jgi:HrpA-like RNA helicase
MAYEPTAGLSKLSEFWISQSSAKQRAGRAGRTGPGQCFRFYSQKEYEAFNDFPMPEVLRTPLEPIILQILALELETNPRHFDFIQQPTATAMVHAIDRLVNLEAIESFKDGTATITPLGKILSILPVDVILGKMLVFASLSDAIIQKLLIVVSSLSVQQPFTRIQESSSSGIASSRAVLYSDDGDPFTFLNLFSEWSRVKYEGRESTRTWAKRHGVEEVFTLDL